MVAGGRTEETVSLVVEVPVDVVLLLVGKDEPEQAVKKISSQRMLVRAMQFK
jgi:hypothetical protein